MRWKFALILVIFMFLISLGLVYAFLAGEPSHDIEKNYGSGDFLKGWINISLENENSGSEFKLNGNTISLIELLNLNSLDNTDYNCTPTDCKKDYSGSAGVVTKTRDINQQGVLIGLKLQGKITGINSFKFDVSSNAGKSCLTPLEIIFPETSWSFNNYSADFTCAQARGECFSSSTEEINVDTKLRCEKINLEKKSAYQIGAWIRKKNNANLTAGLYDLSLEKVEDCKLPDALVSGGEVGCKINEVEAGEYYICISANINSNYTMKYEQTGDKCGFYDAEQFTGEYVIDYDVFAKAAAYSEPGTFTFDNSKLGEDTSLEE